MLLLMGTTDQLQVVTSAAVPVDVHTSWIDSNAGTITPNRQNTNISTATTTSVAGTPGSGVVRNVKTVNIRNRDAALSVDITVRHFDGTLTAELEKITLAAGDVLQYVEGVGWYKIPNPVNAPLPNIATADQAIGASVTAYITNSDLRASAGRPLKVGTVLRWHICIIKSAAGTATVSFDLRVGTLGTTSDTSRATLNSGTQTAVADTAHIFIQCTVRSIAAAGVIHTHMELVHNLAATGWAATQAEEVEVTSSTFDTTVTSLVFGISVTTGASHALTVKECVAEILPGTI